MAQENLENTWQEVDPVRASFDINHQHEQLMLDPTRRVVIPRPQPKPFPKAE